MSQEINAAHNTALVKTIAFRDEYYKMVDSRVFPVEHAFEEYRIKKYNADGVDEFDTHVDVMDHESSRRYLSFMFYLNDVEEGGKTRFQDLVITPEQGSLVVFPPLWMYPHRGECPISNPKYILTTYLHYK